MTQQPDMNAAREAAKRLEADYPTVGGGYITVPTDELALVLAAFRWLDEEKAKLVAELRETPRRQGPVQTWLEQKVLAALIQYPNGLRRQQLTVLTGYKRSSRDAYIYRLTEKNLASVHGDSVTATDEGVAALPDCEPLPRGQDLQSYWINRLPEGERRVLKQLIQAYPNSVSRMSLDEVTGYKRSSRDAYLSRLAAKELVKEAGRGEVIASEELFE